MPNAYLELLTELGIHVDEGEWNDVHGILPEPSPPLRPDRPAYWDEDNHAPVFTTSQIELGGPPEHYGFHDYLVVETDETAHPFALNYEDEWYYRSNHRPKHRYSRPYRIRWTLSHLVGLAGKNPEPVLARLRAELPGPELLQSRSVHEWVRHRLKRWGHKELYLSVPYLVAELGGPRWHANTRQVAGVYADALKLHTTFDALRKQGRLGRQRFPKLQYVLLKLLDRHGVLAPYRVPWARTSIKRRQLRDFLAVLDSNDTPWVIPPTANASPRPSPPAEANGAACWASNTCPPSSNVTPDSSDRPDKSCLPKTTTTPAASATTRITSEDSSVGTNRSPGETCTNGNAVSTR